jgi:HK97 family phage prohead protease
VSKPSKVIPFASSGTPGWLNIDTGRWLPRLAGADPAAPARPPRENILRAVIRGLELRDDGNASTGPVMVGHFSRFNEWTEIDSWFEGNFLERVAPGAYKKTFRENRASMRALFQHGMDPQVGDKPLGPIDELREDTEGAYYEVPLLDAPYVRDLVLPGLRAGLYGASFRFRVMREEYVEEPGVSDYNPKGLPERTIKEASVSEFGPVTFPAYPNATAGVRSLRPSDLTLGVMRADPERTARLMRAAPRDGARMDTEDMSLIAQMIDLGTSYIEEQDEPDDQPNVPVMEGVLQTLSDLMGVEASEIEPDEPEDEDAGGRAAEPDGAARTGNAPSDRDAGTGSHLTATERRETAAPAGGNQSIYGLSQKEREPWRL